MPLVGAGAAILVYLSAIVALVLGWVFNIVQLVTLSSGAINALFVIKVVGIFVAPLGAVLGWIG